MEANAKKPKAKARPNGFKAAYKSFQIAEKGTLPSLSTPLFLQFLFDPGSFADSVTEIVELRSSDMTMTENFNAHHVGRMDGEYPLHAAAVGNTAHGEGFGDPAVLHSNDGAFKHLVSFFVAFTDFNRNANVVADLDSRLFGFHAGLADDLQCVHNDPPKFSDIRTTGSIPVQRTARFNVAQMRR